MDHAARDGAGTDDADLDDEVVEGSGAAGGAASTSGPGSRSGRRPPCRPGRSSRTWPGPRRGSSPWRGPARGASSSSLKQRSSWVSAPSPRRSTLKRPRSSMSSLSHWITVRPFHGRVLDGDQVVHRLVPEQESAGVDGEVAGEILDLVGQARAGAGGRAPRGRGRPPRDARP